MTKASEIISLTCSAILEKLEDRKDMQINQGGKRYFVS
jgi:hypothetical protein